MKRSIPYSVLAIAQLFLAVPARADIAPPDVSSCLGRATGDVCTVGPGCPDGWTGSCVEEICSRVNYVLGGLDGSLVPQTVTYICLSCATGTTTQIRTHSNSWGGTCTQTITATKTAIAIPPPTTTSSGTATATACATSTSTGIGTATVTAPSTSTSTGIDTATVTTPPTSTGTGTDSSSSGDSSWCSVGQGTAVGRIAPWLMAAAFSLIFLFGRRRRPK